MSKELQKSIVFRWDVDEVEYHCSGRLITEGNIEKLVQVLFHLQLLRTGPLYLNLIIHFLRMYVGLNWKTINSASSVKCTRPLKHCVNEKIQASKYELLLEHRPYSPDLAPPMTFIHDRI